MSVPRPGRRWLRLLLGLGACAALVAIAIYRRESFEVALRGANWALLLALLPAASALTLLAPSGWHLVIRGLGADLRWARAVEVWLVSAAARFIPGGIWTFAGRIAMTRHDAIPVAVVGLSLYVETLLIAATSLAVGLPALMIRQPGWPTLALATGIAAGLALLLRRRVMRFLIARVAPNALRGAGASLESLKLGPLALYYCLYWCLWGGLFALFVSAFQPYPAAGAAYILCSFALAYWAGFVSIVFPGGVGIREGVLFALLTPVFPASTALAITVSLRLWMIGAELPVLLGAVLLSRPWRRSGTGLAEQQDVGRQDPI